MSRVVPRTGEVWRFKTGSVWKVLGTNAEGIDIEPHEGGPGPRQIYRWSVWDRMIQLEKWRLLSAPAPCGACDEDRNPDDYLCAACREILQESLDSALR